MMTYNGGKLDTLTDRLKFNNIPQDLIEQFKDTLIINHQGIDGYICTKKGYASVWEKIGFDLILSESKGLEIIWHQSPDID